MCYGSHLLIVLPLIVDYAVGRLVDRVTKDKKDILFLDGLSER